MAACDEAPVAGCGHAAYNGTLGDVGRVPPRGDPTPDESPPRRLRRLHRVWPDRDGNISYLLTLCVDGRGRVLDDEATFQRLTAFLLDSTSRYRWFPRRFVVMPDHIHLIAHQGPEAVRWGQWIKALKAVVGGLERRVDCAWESPVGERPVGGAPGPQHAVPLAECPVRAPGPHPAVLPTTNSPASNDPGVGRTVSTITNFALLKANNANGNRCA